MAWTDALGSVLGGIGDMFQGNVDRGIAKKWLKRGDPFGPYRAQFGQMLWNMMSDPSSFLQNPLFQASQQQGETSAARQMAAQGYNLSGNEEAALFQLGQSNAWDMLTTQEGLLGWLGGANIDPNEAMKGYAKGMSGGTSGIIGGIGKVLGGIFSDRRLKLNVERIGTTPGGIPWYKYDYIWGESSEGVMADEVPQDAVTVDENGFSIVDYTKIH